METPTTILQAHLDRADRNWFEAHPAAEWRKRRYIPGENVSTDQFRPGVTHTVVFRCRDGSLIRRHLRVVNA
jgi:hypothetical protein